MISVVPNSNAVVLPSLLHDFLPRESGALLDHAVKPRTTSLDFRRDSDSSGLVLLEGGNSRVRRGSPGSLDPEILGLRILRVSSGPETGQLKWVS